MNKSRLAFFLISLVILLPVITVSLSNAATQRRDDDDSLSKHLSVFSEVLSLVKRAYVEETSVEDLLAGALDGSTDALDPMATFIPAEAVEKYREVRQIDRRHSGLAVAKERGIAFALSVDEGSPAAAAEIEHGDIISRVNGVSTRRMPLWQFQTLLAGEPGTELGLEILRRGQSLEKTLVLGLYETQPPSLDQREDTAVLRIFRFEQGDVATLREILARLVDSDQEKLLIDLRQVSGGDSQTAYAMAGLFAEGDLGELKTREEATLQFQGMERPLWSGETVLLVDSGSQGAAEVFATVMRQQAGSQLVGRRTFGHAGRQRMIALSDGSQVLLTDAFYSGPDGEPINQGLIPDVTVTEFTRSLAEKDRSIEDLTLERGLEVLLEEGDEASAEEDVA
jgi:carboxyl-terminal processing protease